MYIYICTLIAVLYIYNLLDQKHEDNPRQYKMVRMYMKQVMILLQFLRATRLRDWVLYLASLEKMCSLFFAFNRLDYAQNIPDYIAHMRKLETQFYMMANLQFRIMKFHSLLLG